MPGRDDAASSSPKPKSTASQRGTVVLRQSAIPVSTIATRPPPRYATRSIVETADASAETTTRAAAAAVVCAVAADATLNPTSMFASAPQNAAVPPTTAATRL